MTHGAWMCANTRLNKKPFSFTRYPFQEAIANDEHPNLDCIKPSQIGLTEIQIRKTLAWAKRRPNTSIIYTMPNINMFKRISKARILPILENDKAFRGDGGSMDLLKVGSSYVYVTGAAESDATSINADIVMNDEIDLTDPSMLSLFNSRLQGSDLRINQRFSTPTYEGFGVHSGYLVSDQKRYMIKCQCCNHWQEPIFNRDFVVIPHLPDADKLLHLTDINQQVYDENRLGLHLPDAYIQCEKCHKPLDVGDHANREWVAKFPNRTNARGYKIVTFSTERLTPAYVVEQLLRYRRNDNMKGFYNTVLGEAYTDDNIQLSEALLRQAFTPVMSWLETAPNDYYSVGIDVGKTCHITVARPKGEFPDYVHFESIPQEMLLSRLQRLDEIFNFRCGGIDWTPEWRLACEVRTWSRGRVLPIQYTDSKPVSENKDMTGLITHLGCNRTHLLDVVANGIRSGTTTFSGYGSETQKTAIMKQFRDMVREESKTGEDIPRWKKLSGNDHFFHSCGYAVSGLLYHDALDKLKGPSRTSGIILAPQPNLIVNAGMFNQPNLIGFHDGATNCGGQRSNPFNNNLWGNK